MSSNETLAQFEELLAQRAGLNVRAQDREHVERTLLSRAQTRQETVASYLEWLQGASGASEWNGLFAALTNQESYFFRDTGQFDLLREQILPELIAQNRARRTLKLWSAGCSTGEEPYSLAMTLETMLPSGDRWKVEIHGTDLSEAALQKARAGVYSAWSFRNTPDEQRERFFQKRGHEWILSEKLRRSVQFRYGNLLDDNFASQGLHDFDLILCRNVFIYFRREAVARVVRKFRDTLREDGYLMTGHAELHDIALPDLPARTFPQGVVYQRTASGKTSSTRSATSLVNNRLPLASFAPFSTTTSSLQIAPSARATPITLSAHSRHANNVAPNAATRTPQDDDIKDVQRAYACLREGRSDEAWELLNAIFEKTNGNAEQNGVAIKSTDQNGVVLFVAHCLAAQALANNVRYEEAQEHCARAIAIDALSPLPYSVLARIEIERAQGENTGSESAKEWLKKVIYLAPQSITAMVELSAIYRREGDLRRARSWRDAALQVLNDCSGQECPKNEDASNGHSSGKTCPISPDGCVILLQWSLDEPQTIDAMRHSLKEF